MIGERGSDRASKQKKEKMTPAGEMPKVISSACQRKREPGARARVLPRAPVSIAYPRAFSLPLSLSRIIYLVI